MNPPARLRIATLNCLNLALPARRFYSGVEPYTTDEYIAKTQWLAALFDRLAADFILVQEVFHEQALRDAVSQCIGGPRAYGLAVPLADDRNLKPRVGLIWRTPWQPRIETLSEFPADCTVAIPERGEYRHYSRPLLLARVPWGRDGSALTLLNVHLKSRRPEFVSGESVFDQVAESRAQMRSLMMRAAEAAALRRLVIDLTPVGSMLVLGGDFNDEPNAVTTQLVADTSWKDETRPPRDHVLFNTLDVTPHGTPARGRDVAFTILHGGEPERIDHMFVSEPFVAGRQRQLARVVAVEIYNDHLAERQAHAHGLVAGPDLVRVHSDHAAVCTTVELMPPGAS
jgi:endonuclease/exonuclease/phosphatase family metal-dependent hydrolase